MEWPLRTNSFRKSTMRVSLFTIALAASAFAAPIPKRNILTDIGKAITDLKNNGATFGGVIGAVGDSIKNPGLLISRIEVVKGLNGSAKDLDAIVAQADKTKNTAVSTNAKAAKEGIQAAKDGVSAIGKALFSGAKPQRSDQAKVAAGIKKAEDQVKSLDAATTTKDDTLSKSIASVIKNVALARKGGEGVLKANGLTFEDVGLPANPDATVAPPAAGGDKKADDKKDEKKADDKAAPPAEEAPAAEAPAAEAPAAEAPAEEKATVPNAAIVDEEPEAALEARDHPEDEDHEEIVTAETILSDNDEEVEFIDGDEDEDME
jgi:hypothetical protein